MNKLPAKSPESVEGKPLTPLSAQEILCLNSIMEKIHNWNVKVGWWEEGREVGTPIALIHSEFSEALEGFRKNKMDDHLPHRKNAEVEIADGIIRAFDLAGGCNFNIGAAISEKLIYNMSRADHKKENRMKPGGKQF